KAQVPSFVSLSFCFMALPRAADGGVHVRRIALLIILCLTARVKRGGGLESVESTAILWYYMQ
ncbi:MAG: hypothetical protein IKI49_00870, partial [Oscillospiraceae bacterium]|nr:hypothetical protein [Oscillospiraceae bacterium]